MTGTGLTFREQAAIAFASAIDYHYLDCAAKDADALAQECCAQWGHDGEPRQKCSRCEREIPEKETPSAG